MTKQKEKKIDRCKYAHHHFNAQYDDQGGQGYRTDECEDQVEEELNEIKNWRIYA